MAAFQVKWLDFGISVRHFLSFPGLFFSSPPLLLPPVLSHPVFALCLLLPHYGVPGCLDSLPNCEGHFSPPRQPLLFFLLSTEPFLFVQLSSLIFSHLSNT